MHLFSSIGKILSHISVTSIFPIEEKSSYRTAAGMKSVAKRLAAGRESCKAGFFFCIQTNGSNRYGTDKNFRQKPCGIYPAFW